VPEKSQIGRAPPLSETPCPSCTALLDQLDGAVPHLHPRMSFAVVTKAPLDRPLTFAEERGWRHLRLFSAGLDSYQRDWPPSSARR
jgi:predicted dithiol-disulfide oxidoreductase (DUF899 family)